MSEITPETETSQIYAEFYEDLCNKHRENFISLLEKTKLIAQERDKLDERVNHLEAQIRRAIFYLRGMEDNSRELKRAWIILHEALEQEGANTDDKRRTLPSQKAK